MLDDVVTLTGSAAGSLIVFAPPARPRFKATRVTHDSLTAFTQSDAWKSNPREEFGKRLPRPGFHDVTDNLPPE